MQPRVQHVQPCLRSAHMFAVAVQWTDACACHVQLLWRGLEASQDALELLAVAEAAADAGEHVGAAHA